MQFAKAKVITALVLLGRGLGKAQTTLGFVCALLGFVRLSERIVNSLSTVINIEIPRHELRRLEAATFLFHNLASAAPTGLCHLQVNLDAAVYWPQPLWGWTDDCPLPPRVAARTRQPWAKGRNPVGIPDRFEIP